MLVKQKILFSEEECNSIISLLKINEKYWKLKDRNYLSYAIDLNETTEWIFNKLKDFFEDDTGIQIKKLKKQIHFHKFSKGDWFDKHNDIRDNRIYAVGVLLNNNFEGGDFKIYDNEEIIINKYIGNGYIFDVKLEHEITAILQGERYSLIWFLQTENIKLIKNKLI